MKKTKVAFIKYSGLSSGGTEKYLQTIAAHLPKDRYEVDYYYCDATPYIGSDFVHMDTDPIRVQYLRKNGVNPIKFNVGYKDVRYPTHEWVDTDFWSVFDEKRYDIIQTGRAGHPEYPFYKIKHTPIIDSLHLSGGVDNQFNISRVVHICKWNADKWIRSGGDAKRAVVIYPPVEILSYAKNDLRSELRLNGKFIFGFHQRDDDAIFSPIPLKAFSLIKEDRCHFIVMNGSSLYKKQAQELGIKNITFLEKAPDMGGVYDFLETLDVYAHGRKDGEINSSAIAEAMYFGLPIISHMSDVNNGHVETIGNAGKVVRDEFEYVDEMERLLTDRGYYNEISEKAIERFKKKYELSGQIGKILQLYEEVLSDPYPNIGNRVWLGIKSDLAVKTAKIYKSARINIKEFLKRSRSRLLGKRQYYALNSLDKKMRKYLNKRGGVFVELGANNGIDQSNTFWYEKNLGWTGILIEASPVLSEQCRNNRPKSRVFNCACVSRDYPDKTIKLVFANLMSLVKGMREDEAEHLESAKQFCGSQYEFDAKARTLQSILDECNISRVDLLSLDVEGYELEVLKGCDFSRSNIKYMLIESNSDRLELIKSYLKGDYKIVERMSDNDYLFVKER